jgi:hypothetical protein
MGATRAGAGDGVSAAILDDRFDTLATLPFFEPITADAGSTPSTSRPPARWHVPGADPKEP